MFLSLLYIISSLYYYYYLIMHFHVNSINLEYLLQHKSCKTDVTQHRISIFNKKTFDILFLRVCETKFDSNLSIISLSTLICKDERNCIGKKSYKIFYLFEIYNSFGGSSMSMNCLTWVFKFIVYYFFLFIVIIFKYCTFIRFQLFQNICISTKVIKQL